MTHVWEKEENTLGTLSKGSCFNQPSIKTRGPSTVYDGSIITLHCHAGPYNPGNNFLAILYKYLFTIILGIKNLKWESEKIQGQENPTEFVYLIGGLSRISRIITKASLTFTVKYLKLRQMLHSIIL